MIRPKEMKKVSIIGPKSQLGAVVERLHELGVLHIDDYSEEDGKLDIGGPQEEADQLSNTLVKLRSVRSKLPETDSTGREENGDIEEHLERLQASINDIYDDLDEVREEKEQTQHLISTLHVLERLGLNTSDITPYSSLDTYIGTVSNVSFLDDLPDGRYELYQDEHLIGLFVDAEVDMEDALRSANFDAVDMAPVEDTDEPVQREMGQAQEQLQHLQNKEQELEEELQEIASEWRGYLDQKEYELSAELEKAEAPLQFAVTDRTFAAEGWLPTEQFDAVHEELDGAADGRIHIEELESNSHEAPVEHDNPNGVNYFEDLVGFFGTPSYTEVDPTFLLITFPLLFGFMLGDVGYGLTTFAVFYLMYRKFPEGEGLWKSLMYASVATIVFGLVYAEMFGYIIFGHESVLAELTGLHIFAEIPILFHRGHELGTVLMLSLIMGIAHVNFGFLLGAYNEYVNHGLLEAFYAKGSWIIIEIGAALWYLQGATVGAPMLLAGVVLLYKGEGIEGVVEIPSLLSNILSYLRIFGVSIAIIALAAVVNQIAAPLFQSANPVMIGLGVLLLVMGHTINTFLKLMEAGLQGIRLHYVEFFTKFFHGGGERYVPFGASFKKS